jgi:hypothetical protein
MWAALLTPSPIWRIGASTWIQDHDDELVHRQLRAPRAARRRSERTHQTEERSRGTYGWFVVTGRCGGREEGTRASQAGEQGDAQHVCSPDEALVPRADQADDQHATVSATGLPTRREGSGSRRACGQAAA